MLALMLCEIAAPRCARSAVDSANGVSRQWCHAYTSRTHPIRGGMRPASRRLCYIRRQRRGARARRGAPEPSAECQGCAPRKEVEP